MELRRGEVLYLPAGNIHAYLNGIGVELMSASDNVLRGGLTPKHVDVPELLHVLDFQPVPLPFLLPTDAGPGVSLYSPGVRDFELFHVFGDDLDVVLDLPGESIVLCVAGEMALTSTLGAGPETESRPVTRGQSDYVVGDSPDGDLSLRVTGAGELFVATIGTALS